MIGVEGLRAGGSKDPKLMKFLPGKLKYLLFHEHLLTFFSLFQSNQFQGDLGLTVGCLLCAQLYRKWWDTTMSLQTRNLPSHS